MIHSGIDLVSIKRFSSLATPEFLERIFHQAEVNAKKIETLSGYFAIKEAAIKAGIIAVGEWKRVEIKTEQSGAIYLLVDGVRSDKLSISMSHEDGYAIGLVVLLEHKDVGE